MRYRRRIIARGDILGDWRKEIITFTEDGLQIYTTTIPASDRRTTLTQASMYRIDVTLISQRYEQASMAGFNLGSK